MSCIFGESAADWVTWMGQLPAWSGIASGFPIIVLMGGLAGVLANFGIERRNPWLRAVIIFIALCPLLYFSIIVLDAIDRKDPGYLILGALYLPPFLGFIAAGLLLKGSGSFFRINKKSVILLGLPVGLSAASLLASRDFDQAVRRSRAETGQIKGVALWHDAERKLGICARTLNAGHGESDAKTNFIQGNRRLYAAISVYQESEGIWIPGIDTSEDQAEGPYWYVVGRAKTDKISYSYGVQASPRGSIWTDPWSHVSRAMGRPPPSAKPCENATLAYIGAYNIVMLRLGALKKTPVPTRKFELPFLWKTRIQNPGVYQGLYADTSRAQYLLQLALPIRVLAPGRHELTQSDIDAEKSRTLAQARHGARAQISRYDRNGDGAVTWKEVVEAYDGLSGEEQAKWLFNQYDLNQDRVITIPEAEIAAGEDVRRRAYPLSMIELILSRDPNHDGRLTEEELAGLGSVVFSFVDTDGNGVISDQEEKSKQFDIAGRAIQEENEAAQKFGAGCKSIPPVRDSSGTMGCRSGG